MGGVGGTGLLPLIFFSLGVGVWVSFRSVLDLESPEIPKGSPRGERTNTRTNLYKGENKEEGTGEGTDIAIFTRLIGFYGVFSLG
jgi:hypothetical protein